MEAIVFYGGVDGYAHIYRELVYRLEHEGVASEDEGVEVSLFVVEDDVEDAEFAEVEEVGGEAAGEAEKGTVEHSSQRYRKDMGDEGVCLYAGKLAEGLAQAKLY